MEIMALIIGMALVTYIPRALPAVIMDKLNFGYKTQKFLSLIPYTALAALIFPGILTVEPAAWYVGAAGGAAAILLSLVRKMPIIVTVAVSIGVVMLFYVYGGAV